MNLPKLQRRNNAHPSLFYIFKFQLKFLSLWQQTLTYNKYVRRACGTAYSGVLIALDCVYKILHLSGYYDGIENANVIKEGFEDAKILIEKIKPE